MNQREYESGLKDLLEHLVGIVAELDEPRLYDLYLPQNVPGARRVPLLEWVAARESKRNR